MSDDNPISKWRAAGQQHPAVPDKARTDTYIAFPRRL
jgi:hypothetical protein